MCLVPSVARATSAVSGTDVQFGQPWQIDPADPIGSVPSQAEANADPMAFSYFLLELARRADEAEKSGDRGTAIAHWQAVAKAVPRSAEGPRRACALFDAPPASERARALELCAEVLEREGVELEDFRRWLAIALDRSRFESDDVEALQEVIDHLVQDPSPDAQLLGQRGRCKLSVSIQSLEGLQKCSSVLMEHAPDDRESLAFRWHLAVLEHDEELADDLVERLKELGLSRDGVAQMKLAMREHMGQSGCGTPSAWILSFTGLFLLFWISRKKFRRPRSFG